MSIHMKLAQLFLCYVKCKGLLKRPGWEILPRNANHFKLPLKHLGVFDRG